MMIREANVKDLDEIIKLTARFHDFIHQSIYNDDSSLKKFLKMKHNSKQIIQEFFIEKITSKTGSIFILQDEGNIIGYIFIYIKNNISFYKIKEIGYIGHVYLEKRYRNKGHSTKLLRAAVDWFKKRNMKYIGLAVNKFNVHAHDIYLKMGFKDSKIEMIKELE